jgi:hypothetical protein
MICAGITKRGSARTQGGERGSERGDLTRCLRWLPQGLHHVEILELHLCDNHRRGIYSRGGHGGAEDGARGNRFQGRPGHLCGIGRAGGDVWEMEREASYWETHLLYVRHNCVTPRKSPSQDWKMERICGARWDVGNDVLLGPFLDFLCDGRVEGRDRPS